MQESYGYYDDERDEFPFWGDHIVKGYAWDELDAYGYKSEDGSKLEHLQTQCIRTQISRFPLEFRSAFCTLLAAPYFPKLTGGRQTTYKP